MIVCNKCGYQNSDDSVFCSECGGKLIQICPSCHVELARNAKFCYNCGKKLLDDPNQSSNFASNLSNGSVVAGDVHTTIIYNQENKHHETQHSEEKDVFCHTCGKKLVSASKNDLQCSVCGMYFCDQHIDIHTHKCYQCYEKILSAFEFHRFDNGKYAILGVKNKDSLSIVIPDCVESIEDEAFKDCKMLTVTFPKTLLKIGDRAFENCKSLTTVKFPYSLKIIGDEAFKGCEKMDGYIVPYYGVSIGKNAFEGTLTELRRQNRQASRVREENQTDSDIKTENEVPNQNQVTDYAEPIVNATKKLWDNIKDAFFLLTHDGSSENNGSSSGNKFWNRLKNVAKAHPILFALTGILAIITTIISSAMFFGVYEYFF